MIIQSIPNDFSVCKVEDYSLVNWRAEYVFTAKTDEENSLVCKAMRTGQCGIHG